MDPVTDEPRGGAARVWDALLGHFEARASYFQICDRHRLRPDAWMKVEALQVLHSLENQGQVRQIRPDRQGADVSFVAEGGEWWLALRGLLTSYAGAGRNAPSTLASIEAVTREMDKLRGLSTLSGGSPALFLAAFAFGPEPMERREWQSQMLRFEAKGFDPPQSRGIPLGSDREARLYLFS
jgi:hypothetical protein